MLVGRRGLLAGGLALPLAALASRARAETQLSPPAYPADASGYINQALASAPGRYKLPYGQFYLANSVAIPDGVELIGEGARATILYGLVYFANGAGYCALKELQVVGPHTNTVYPLTIPPDNVGHVLRDLIVSGGASALSISGVDCHVENCYFTGALGNAPVTSAGANWYERCKFDSYGSPQLAGYLQGNSPSSSNFENHFHDCDFSGPYNYSVAIEDNLYAAVTVFDGCVMSAPVLASGAKWTALTHCELAQGVQNYSGNPCTVANCWAGAPTQLVGSNFFKQNNVNIT